MTIKGSDGQSYNVVGQGQGTFNSVGAGAGIASFLGLNAASRARKISTLRSFYKYLTVKTKQLDHDPVADLDTPKIT